MHTLPEAFIIDEISDEMKTSDDLSDEFIENIKSKYDIDDDYFELLVEDAIESLHWLDSLL
jgi:hypothetical protein